MDIKTYDWIIDYIEQSVSSPQEDGTFVTSREIKDMACREFGRDVRGVNTIFEVLTGYAFSQYIKRRRMMSVYLDMKNGKYNLDVAIEKSEQSDQSNYNRAFKMQFGCSPSEVMDKGTFEDYEEPAYWKNLGAYVGEQKRNANIKEDEPPRLMMFGLDMSAIQKYKSAKELQMYYDFSDTIADCAFRISQQWNIELRPCFDLMAYLTMNDYLSDDENGRDISSEKLMSKLEWSMYRKCKLGYFLILWRMMPQHEYDDLMEFAAELLGQKVDLFQEKVDDIRAFFHPEQQEYTLYREFMEEWTRFGEKYPEGNLLEFLMGEECMLSPQDLLSLQDLLSFQDMNLTDEDMDFKVWNLDDYRDCYEEEDW